MPQVKVHVEHQLPREVAIDRLQQYSQRIRGDFQREVAEVQETWSDGIAQFSFRVMGFSVSGRTIVHFDRAEVHVQLPFAAIPFRGMIEKEIVQRLEQALSEETA